MKIYHSKHFKKNFLKRIPVNSPLEKKYLKRVDIFIVNNNNDILKNHKLTGKLSGYYAFSITGDIRVIYFYNSASEATFIDVGSHNQVYEG